MPQGTEGEQLAGLTNSQPVAADPPDFDRAALETTVASKMAAVFADGDDTLVGDVTPAAETEQTTTEQNATQEGQTPAATEGQETTEGEQETEQAAATPGQAKPTAGTANPAESIIPAAYRRSLKAYEWTDEEIDAAAKADPAGFLKAAGKIHSTRNEETRRMSDLGRQIKAQESAAKATRTTPAELPTEFKPIDVAGLKAKYGDEPFIQQLEQVNSVVAFANHAMPWIKQSQERQAAAEMESLGRRIDEFFGSKDMEPYHDQYGKVAAKLTDPQTTTRQKVLETADLLISGARAMGRNLTLEEALTTAHDSVSGPIRETAARTKIVQQVKARTQAISLRPGTKVAPKPSDSTMLQNKVRAGLAKAFKT